MSSGDAAQLPEPIRGISLEQFAGVSAALIERFPLSAILAVNGLDAAAWSPAGAGWSARLAAAGPSSTLLSAYLAALGKAGAWLGRRVQPLDEDLTAWLCFLGACSSHPSPGDLLDGAGVRADDISRIQRGWSARMEADEALRKQAIEIALKKPSAMPAVSITPAQLRPFPWSNDAKTKTPSPARTAPAPGVATMLDISFYRYVAAKARAVEEPGDADAALRKLGYEDFAKVDAAWQARLREDVALAGDYRRLLQHERGRLRAARKRAESGLPMHAPASDPSAQLAPPTPRAPRELAGTALALDIPRGPALPFAKDAAASAGPPAPVHREAPALPSGTSLSLDVPRDPVLPFAKEVPGPPAPAAEPVETRTTPARRKRSPLEEVSLHLEIPRDLPPPKGAAAARPYVPALTLEQHASLCVELALNAGGTAETLSRYRLTPEEKARVDEHYRAKTAASPEARALWDHAYWEYHAWLVQSRRR
jgi:hypothetical protein